MSAAALEIAAELDASQAERSALGVAATVAATTTTATADAAPTTAAALAAPAITAPDAAPLATGDIVTIGHESAAAGQTPASGKLIRILEWMNAPLARSPVLRDAVGKVAIMTLINAIAILIYVKFIQHEPAPTAQAPGTTQAHSPPGRETAP
jgi:hypothetical protein